MKLRLSILLIAGLLAGGCASNEVNPATAKESTGYADFYVQGRTDLKWEVKDVARNKKIFYELEPIEGGVLRLALAPGRHTLAVRFLNLVVLEAEAKEIEVRDGMVTPVEARLEEAGTVRVRETTERMTSAAAPGRRRSAQISTPESTAYRVVLQPEMPVPYQKKEAMPYKR